MSLCKFMCCFRVKICVATFARSCNIISRHQEQYRSHQTAPNHNEVQREKIRTRRLRLKFCFRHISLMIIWLDGIVDVFAYFKYLWLCLYIYACRRFRFTENHRTVGCERNIILRFNVSLLLVAISFILILHI